MIGRMEYSTHSHYKVVCRFCATATKQCRCGGQKTVRFTVCSSDACQELYRQSKERESKESESKESE
jgi:hypothetical protein